MMDTVLSIALDRMIDEAQGGKPRREGDWRTCMAQGHDWRRGECRRCGAKSYQAAGPSTRALTDVARFPTAQQLQFAAADRRAEERVARDREHPMRQPTARAKAAIARQEADDTVAADEARSRAEQAAWDRQDAGLE